MEKVRVQLDSGDGRVAMRYFLEVTDVRNDSIFVYVIHRMKDGGLSEALFPISKILSIDRTQEMKVGTEKANDEPAPRLPIEKMRIEDLGGVEEKS